MLVEQVHELVAALEVLGIELIGRGRAGCAARWDWMRVERQVFEPERPAVGEGEGERALERLSSSRVLSGNGWLSNARVRKRSDQDGAAQR